MRKRAQWQTHLTNILRSFVHRFVKAFVILFFNYRCVWFGNLGNAGFIKWGKEAVISEWQALIRGLCTHWSGGWSGTDHLTAYAVITWLVVHWSRVYHTVITWLRDADHVTVPSVITWLSRHWYRDWACTDHVPGAGEAFHSGPPVSLASQSHHEKPPEVTCTSRGTPGEFPGS